MRLNSLILQAISLHEGNCKLVFFLGGYDAEMLTIREMLIKNNETIFDKKLSWNNAKLSAYKDEIKALSEKQIPVFIELELDYSYPEYAKIIDHHNEKAGRDKETSIEQVGKLLGINLDRYQQLISANDKGHINGMRMVCATDEEIQKIRAFDRKAQGVTQEDEKLAIKSIDENLEIINTQSVIINSLSEKTSPIVDILYEKYCHIFIYTPAGTLTYSGTGEIIQKFENFCNKLNEKDKNLNYWKGGDLPKRGYFGADKPISRDIIIDIVKTTYTGDDKPL
ncbi:MAG: hypothetical protein HQK65_17485 [Desulfamplus sp.]|nr:hypothetical protein [Desulfamplus sp.]